MARYSTGHKAETRQRIVSRAGARLKQDGIDGSGLAAVMSDAGLTNGAFYAHFASKDALVATVVAEQLAAQRDVLAAMPPGPGALETFARDYLSPAHRDAPAAGCPSAALLDEIARSSDAVRTAYASGADQILDQIAARLDPANPRAARGRAIGLFTLLVGTLQLSRAVADPPTSDEVLLAGIENVQLLIGTPRTGSNTSERTPR